MIERKNHLTRDTPCLVTSARTMALGGKRAIYCTLPYSMVVQYFNSADCAEVCAYAEFKEGHLEIYERASKREYFLHAADHFIPVAITH